MSLDLSRLAGVAPSLEICGVAAIHKFQIFFATKATASIVLAFETHGHRSDPLYNGSWLVLKTARKIDYTSYIMFYERSRHFQPIFHLVGAYGLNKFRASCNREFDGTGICSNKCHECLQSPPCAILGNLVMCRGCRRDFFRKACFQNHLKANSFDEKFLVCERLKICSTCCKTVRSQSLLNNLFN